MATPTVVIVAVMVISVTLLGTSYRFVHSVRARMVIRTVTVTAIGAVIGVVLCGYALWLWFSRSPLIAVAVLICAAIAFLGAAVTLIGMISYMPYDRIARQHGFEHYLEYLVYRETAGWTDEEIGREIGRPAAWVDASRRKFERLRKIGVSKT